MEARSEIARSIRHTIEPLREFPRQWEPLRDRALLIELAQSPAEVAELLEEVKALGVGVDHTPAPTTRSAER